MEIGVVRQPAEKAQAGAGRKRLGIRCHPVEQQAERELALAQRRLSLLVIGAPMRDRR